MKMEIKKLQEGIKEVKDPRQQWGNLRHKLEDIVKSLGAFTNR